MIQVHVQATECGFKSHQLQYRKTAGKPLILLGFSAVLFLASFFELMRKRIKKFSQMVGNAIITALEFVSGIDFFVDVLCRNLLLIVYHSHQYSLSYEFNMVNVIIIDKSKKSAKVDAKA